MTPSIVQISGIKECCICRANALEQEYYGELTSEGLHRHHTIYGRGMRPLAEKYGLWVWLCPDHHEFGASAVHSGSKEGKENDRILKRISQRAFERRYGHDKWMEVFGKNYMD